MTREPTDLVLRRALLLVGAVAAVTAVLAGLARLGTNVAWGPAHAGAHGLLFVGVFRVVIPLERAVALGHRAALVVPALGAAALVGTLLGVADAAWLAVLGALGLVILNVWIVRRTSAAFTWLMLLGSLSLVTADLMLALGAATFEVVPGWIAFLVLTIAAERLELSRLTPTPEWAADLHVVLAVAVAVLAAAGALWPEAWRALGVVLASLAAWQLRFDVARWTVRQRGLPRYVATGVLGGAAWLLVGGALLSAHGLPPAGPIYDAILHAGLVGYVLSMVMAHAPLILPAVAKIRLPPSRLFYLPLGTLWLGLAVRLAGDLSGRPELRLGGSILDAVALALLPAAVFVSRTTYGHAAPLVPAHR